ncbi:MAG: rRNA pseudouridine synthase [Chitinophagia bacterium]|nr:rRNA pseudouridine synthase [Chitinophagia bacterium]
MKPGTRSAPNKYGADKPFANKDRKNDKGAEGTRPAANAPKKPQTRKIDLDEEEDDEEEIDEAPRRRKLSWKQEEKLANVKEKAPVKDEKMPLNKYLAHGGITSRRDAAGLVKQGVVKVNDTVVTEPGYKVLPEDVVTVHDKLVTPQKGLVYILLNKPKDYITTNDDPQGRRTVMELVQGAEAERLFPVGRLDRHTTGLLLITNDGDLTQRLSHPAFNIKKVYQVTLDKALTKADFEKIANGLELEDGPVQVDAIAMLEKKNEIGVEIHSGKNRIVRRIFEHLGYEVEKLDRVMYAGLTKKNLPRGKWRYLNEKEVVFLKHFKGQKN